jgi:hypothetical protein
MWIRPQPFSATTRAFAWLIGVLVILGSSIVVLAQEGKTLPPAHSILPHSTVDISTLPVIPRGTGPRTGPTEVRPFRVPDPARLRQWKDHLEQSPQALPPAPGFVEDKQR